MEQRLPIPKHIICCNSPISLFPRLGRSSKQMICTATTSSHLRSKRSTRVHLTGFKRNITIVMYLVKGLNMHYSFAWQQHLYSQQTRQVFGWFQDDLLDINLCVLLLNIFTRHLYFELPVPSRLAKILRDW